MQPHGGAVIDGRRLSPGTLLVAHRAGNDPTHLRRAQELGADAVEADVHLHRGSLEVRHTKRLGPLPFEWDRWFVRRRPPTAFLLEHLLASIGRGTEVMLDLKGIDRRLPHALRPVLANAAGRPSLIVCSRNWRLLDQLPRDGAIRRVYSAGSRRQLAVLAGHVHRVRGDGVSVHARLLTPEVTTSLAGIAPLLITWAAETSAAVHQLARGGVNGFVLDDMALLQAAAASRQVAVAA